ncbi:MAG: MFS transporter, partial [Planctomycetes bacterium]|nr:MFS transporter [Planctomycetota bacterium]
YLIVAFAPMSASSRLGPGDLLDTSKLSAAVSETTAAAASGVPLRLTAMWDGVPAVDDREQLRNQLNAIIARRDAFGASDVQGLSLEREAMRLFERPRNELSQAEVERLNRLILEAAFPDSIRKVYGVGWPWVMIAYGFIGVAVAAACWAITRDRPAVHPRVNEAELDLIRYGRPKEATASEGLARGLPLGRIVASRSLWLSCISQWCTNVGWIFLVAWLPTYLERVHQTPVESRAWLAAIPLTVGWLGMLGGGWLTDRLVSRVGLRWGRALPMSLTRFLAMSAYLMCLFDLPVWAAVAAFSVVAFATDLGTASTWAFCQDVGGRHVGSVLGWGNMWGNLGAFVTPPLLIWIVGDSYDWNRAFLTCAAAFFVAGVAAIGINATIPVAPEE